MSDYNKILHQQCNIELQINCKISVKSVNLSVVLVQSLKK